MKKENKMKNNGKGGEMNQRLFYKAKDGNFYPCKLEIKELPDVGRSLIFTIYEFNKDGEELCEFTSTLKEPLNVNICIPQDDLSSKILDAVIENKGNKDFKYVDDNGNTFAYEENSKRWGKSDKGE